MSGIHEYGLNTSILLSQLEKAANPYKGTSLEALNNAEQKFSQIVNPFKGTSWEAMSKAQEKYKQIYDALSGTERVAALMSAQELKIDGSNYLSTERAMQKQFKPNPLEGVTLDVFKKIGETERAIRESAEQLAMFQNTLSAADMSNIFSNGFLEFDLTFNKLNISRDTEEKPELSTNELNEPQTNSGIIKIDDVIKTEKLIKSIYDDNEELYRVDPFDFEAMIAELLRKQGYIVELTKRTRDGGIDIIALHDLNRLGVNRYFVECKRHAKDRPVGVGVLKSLCYNVQNKDANKGMIFTSSYFSHVARKLQQSEHKYVLELQDGMDILNWIRTIVESKQYK